MALDLPVILGTIREGRQSEHVARWAHKRLSARPGITSAFVDPRDLPFGNLVEREFEMKVRPPVVAKFVDDMTHADGFLVVTPEYNHGIPGALKNLLDITFKPWNRKPFAYVGCSNGMAGGLRVIEGMRQVTAGLGAVSVPAHMPVPNIDKAFGPDGPLADAEQWAKRIDKVFDGLIWYAEALQAKRSAPPA
jgi:NAD(P)H-dependent FMN reductase